MDDLIRRQAAIAYAISGRIRTLPTSEDGENWIRTEDVRQSLSTMPSAQPEQKWIPCSERLPREEEQDDELGVLVTLGNGYSGLQCDWYHGDHWYDWDGFVVAWMPLPPVYQEGDNK